ncbi:MAG: amidohydrolase [Acidimicrobiales bacterium]
MGSASQSGEIDRAKEATGTTVLDAADALVELSHLVWAHPEVAFEERQAADWTADALATGGFDVTMGVGDLPTAYTATYGTGDLEVAVCVELDALPGIGHACGHNIIAAAGVGAGLGLRAVADDLGLRIRVVGTPAEELGGGKILLLERGVFDGTHLAMMVHPSPVEGDAFATLAVAQCDVHYRGRTAHASVSPHLGVNAADAITVAQVALGLLRQHLDRGDQVHGIVTTGGEAANIVPGYASARYFWRAPSLEALARLEPRVLACFEAGAVATGATLELEQLTLPYSEFDTDTEIAALYRANAESLGRTFGPRAGGAAGSTDMANLSLLMPTIHPMLGLDSLPAVNHQPEFADFCRTPTADQALIDGARAMAATVVDAALTPAVRQRLMSAADTVYGHRDTYPWRF